MDNKCIYCENFDTCSIKKIQTRYVSMQVANMNDTVFIDCFIKDEDFQKTLDNIK